MAYGAGIIVEQEKSRKEWFDVHGTYAEREFVCDWPERMNVSPRIGDVYPFIDAPTLYVQKVTIDPEGHADGEGKDDAYTYARLFVYYTTRNHMLPTESIEMGVECLEAAYNRLWASDSAAIEQHVTTTHFRSELVIDRSYFNPPWGTIAYMTDKINEFPFRGCPVGTVLFPGGPGRGEYTNLGEGVWRLQLHFIYREEPGWNYIWRQDTGAWDMPVPYIHTYADLNSLLL